MLGPVIAWFGLPQRPFKTVEGQPHGRRQFDRPRLHAGGVGVQGVDPLGHPLRPDEVGQAVFSAERAEVQAASGRRRDGTRGCVERVGHAEALCGKGCEQYEALSAAIAGEPENWGAG